MKKTIITASIALAVGAIFSPVVGMAIGETRSVILGMAPDEAVLQLADKIDTSKVEIASKNQELETQIADLTKQNNDLEAKISGQLSQSEKKIATTDANVSNETACRKATELYSNIPAKPAGACGVMGPTNIADMYNKIKAAYEQYKDDDKTKDGSGVPMGTCFKKYLDALAPAYSSYAEAKKQCN